MKCDVVFEGGGAKGIALVGAWKQFQDQGLDHDRLLGTSAGAIMATFLAAGYSMQEMFDVLTEKKDGVSVMASFLGEPEIGPDEDLANSAIAEFLQDVDLPLLPDVAEAALDVQLLRAMLAKPKFRNLYSFVEYGGWYSAGAFVDWLEEKLDAGMVNGSPRRFSGMTFEELHDKTGVDLSLVASDTWSGRLLVLNHRTAPKCPIKWAVRMSMSIPLLWQEVIWQEEWGPYMGKSITGHAIVDGGMLSNFPLELFITDQTHVTDLMGPKSGAPVVGFLIDDARRLSSVTGASRGLVSDVNIGRLDTVLRVRRLVDTMITAHDKLVMDAYADLVVRLPAFGYGTVEFDMSDERRDALIEAGRLATQQHLAAHPPGSSSRGVTSPDAVVAREMADRIATDILQP